MLFTTLIIVLTDFAWRTVEMPVAALALCGAVLLLIGNSAIFVLAARSANSPP